MKAKGVPVTPAVLAAHATREDAWIAIEGQVYDISAFAARHPGGHVLMYYKGADATEPFFAFHPEATRERRERLLRSLWVGTLAAPESRDADSRMVGEFRALESDLHRQGMYRADKRWYLLFLLHVFVFEAAAVYLLAQSTTSWLTWLPAVLLLAVAQIQAGWLQHDFGHLSVFETPKFNQWAHWFTIGFMKGASSDWWKFRHNRHHAKTNVQHRDPDIHVNPVFLFGDQGKIGRKLGWLLTPFQALYWWVVGPPTVTTFVFFIMVVRHLMKTKEVPDIIAVFSYFARFYIMFGWGLGMNFWQMTTLYFSVRLIESHWFTWVTSMNHLPMPINLDADSDKTWIELHVLGTQNVHGTYANDWITGHLNYQVEHHLFPRMPRHNYSKVQPQVEKLLAKYGLAIQKRPLFGAMADVITSLNRGATLYRSNQLKKSQ